MKFIIQQPLPSSLCSSTVRSEFLTCADLLQHLANSLELSGSLARILRGRSIQSIQSKGHGIVSRSNRAQQKATSAIATSKRNKSSICRTSAQSVQGVWRRQHLSSRATTQSVQGVWREQRLPARTAAQCARCVPSVSIAW